MRIFLIIITIIGASLSGFAQTKDKLFSKQDSLRGFLFPQRANYDVRHYDIYMELDIAGKAIKDGKVAMKIDVLKPMPVLQFDLYENMTVDAVLVDGVSKPFNPIGNAVFVDMKMQPLKQGSAVVEIQYHGQPTIAKRAPWDGGFVWKRDEKDQHWIGVACEGDGASLWWPCKDHLSDEPEDGVQIEVAIPSHRKLMAVANGRLIATNGAKNSYTWKVINPINTYNVSITVAEFAHFEDTFEGLNGTLPIDYYVLSYNIDKAKEHFKQVKPMLTCFEHFFGPYPFYKDGYKLVETPYLGMEHQSNIAYGNNYQIGYNGNDLSGIGFDYLIIHESGHEWYGNNISAPDVAELWIHESFTTYSEALYVEYMSSYDTAVDYLIKQRDYIKNVHPMMGNFGVNEGHHDTDIYYKGSWMLHTIRSIVNDDEKWFAMIKKMNKVFYHKVVKTEDVVGFMSRELGLDCANIMYEYLTKAHPPKLQWKTEQKEGKTYLVYKWVNASAAFAMPVGFIHPSGDKIMVQPGLEWKTRKLNKIDDWSFDERSYYVLSTKVE